MLARQPVEGRAGGVLLHDLLLEREAVDAMTSHGLTPARPSSLVNRRLFACPAGGAHSKDAATFDLNCQAALARVASLRSGEAEPVAAPATFDLNSRRAIGARGVNNRLVAVRPNKPNIGVKVPRATRYGAAFPRIDTLDEWPLARRHCFGGAGDDDGDPDQGRIRPPLHETPRVAMLGPVQFVGQGQEPGLPARLTTRPISRP